MVFDQNNEIVELCTRGMSFETEGKDEEALKIFEEAWSKAITDFERFTSAHYVARLQNSIAEKLRWDVISLEYALKIDDEKIKSCYPSLYLNIGKCYEDLEDFENARNNYETALAFVGFLPDDRYGHMIQKGIMNGLERLRVLK